MLLPLLSSTIQRPLTRLLPRHHRVVAVTSGSARLRWCAVVVAALLVSGACGGDDAGVESPSALLRSVVLVSDASSPVALTAEPDGGFLFGERLTGRIRHVDAAGRLDEQPVAVVDTVGAEGDQRGLLGIARSDDGTIFVSWTRRSDGRLVVGRIATDAERSATTTPDLIWEGPVSVDQANGGGLAVAPDGTVVIGIGDLLAPHDRGDDPSVPNRKMLSLDPGAPADQVPTVLSTGWNNPYAIVAGADGVIWVADNAAGDNPERMGRADRSAALGSDLDETGGQVAPAGLVALGGDRFGVCGYVSHRLDEVRVTGGRAHRTGRVIMDGCWTSVAQLADGRLVTATLDEIRVVAT